jgi:hypothetical protein
LRARLRLNPLLVTDPGLLRLRQAARTVIAVAISLALFHSFGSLIALFAAFAAAAFMQANSGTSRRQRQMVMTVTGAATAVLVFAGGLCHGHRVAMELMLIGAAAGCFYARRFVPDRNLFTLYSFTLALLAATFSGPWPHPLWLALAVFSGLPIAFLVYFYVWPPVFHVRFAAAVSTFEQLVAYCLEALSVAVERGGEEQQITRRIARLRSAMSACATLATPLRGSASANAADAAVRLMRRIVVCFELLEEHLAIIADRQAPDLADASRAIGAAFRALCHAYASNIPASVSVEDLRAPVIAAFERVPDHERNKHTAAALIEAGTLAVRLEQLRRSMAGVLSDPAFTEER